MEHACSERNEYILTEGGLVRTLKAGCPEQSMHLWSTGAFRPGEPNGPVDLQGKHGRQNDLLVEIELLRIEGNNAVVRLWAPDHVRIVSAKKDPRCQPNLDKPQEPPSAEPPAPPRSTGGRPSRSGRHKSKAAT